MSERTAVSTDGAPTPTGPFSQAIRVGTKESLEPVGGLSQALETARKIQARREKEGSAKPMRVTAQAWTSTRIASSESDA